MRNTRLMVAVSPNAYRVCVRETLNRFRVDKIDSDSSSWVTGFLFSEESGPKGLCCAGATIKSSANDACHPRSPSAADELHHLLVRPDFVGLRHLLPLAYHLPFIPTIVYLRSIPLLRLSTKPQAFEYHPSHVIHHQENCQCDL